MIWLVSYFRRAFCKHALEYKDQLTNGTNDENVEVFKNRVRTSVTCRKCGYHISYWKFR